MKCHRFCKKFYFSFIVCLALHNQGSVFGAPVIVRQSTIIFYSIQNQTDN